MKGPDYRRICRHTVTLYNALPMSGGLLFHRTVFVECAYMELGRSWRNGASGERASEDALVVLPPEHMGRRYLSSTVFDTAKVCDAAFTLRPGDKILRGVGPEIDGVDAWLNYIPERVDGLLVVSGYHVVHWLDGSCAHIEVGSIGGGG